MRDDLEQREPKEASQKNRRRRLSKSGGLSASRCPGVLIRVVRITAPAPALGQSIRHYGPHKADDEGWNYRPEAHDNPANPCRETASNPQKKEDDSADAKQRIAHRS